MSNRLCIIGNGFDRFHGIASDYRDFAHYLAGVDRRTFQLVDRYFSVDEDFWGGFEARLADFDADHVMEDASGFLMSYGADDWSDSGHHDYEYEIDQVVTGLTRTLYDHFRDWVRALPIPRRGAAPFVRVIDPQARFLSFNYTPTLQALYGVPFEHVLHIHGRAEDDRLVLGHGWERTERLASQVDEDTDVRVAGGYDLIDDYFARTFKPTAKIIAEQQAYFASLRHLEEIYVLGHSLSEVDLPYYDEILDHIDTGRVRWTISYRSDPAKERAAFEPYGLPPELVRYLPLADL